MFDYNSLDWAMGFQWPIIILFAVLLAIGTTRLLTLGEEEQWQSGCVCPTNVQKARRLDLKRSANQVRSAGRLIRGGNANTRPFRTMRQHVRRQGPATVARSKRG